VTVRYIVGDTRDVTATIDDDAIDLIFTSTPFLALRSYLPADHPLKHLEIGSEANPAAFIDVLLQLTAEWGRVLAPHGTLAVELGDTYAGSGGAGGDYNPGGLREGQEAFTGSGLRNRTETKYQKVADVQGIGGGITNMNNKKQPGGPGWPLAKSLAGIPQLYMIALAYGINPLTGQPSPAGRWRIRNVIAWHRPNPPVGALGDKWRPASSYITVACKGARRWFDLDAVRTEHSVDPSTMGGNGGPPGKPNEKGSTTPTPGNPAGAPPLDWHTDGDLGTGHIILATAPFSGAHFATWPPELCRKVISSMCARWVCPACGPLDSSHDRDMRNMQGADNESLSIQSSQTEVLFSSVCDGVSSANPARANSSPGLSSEEQAIRLRSDPMAGAPDGEQVRCDIRASTGDGRSSRPDARARGGCSPQERDSGRQPDRESRGDEQRGPSSDSSPTMETEAVSPLRRNGSGGRSCPTCGGDLRPGLVFDPFAGTGTTLAAAQDLGRDAIGCDLDPRNADLARERVGMFLETEELQRKVVAVDVTAERL